MHKVSNSFIDALTAPMNGVGKRSFNQITPSDFEVQNLGSQTIGNTFPTPWFECSDILKLIALELDFETLNSWSLVSKAFRSVYRTALVENINAEKESYNKPNIHSLDKFTDLLKESSQNLLNLQLIDRKPDVEKQWLINESLLKKIASNFSKIHSLSLINCALNITGFYNNLKSLPLKKLNLSSCRLARLAYGNSNRIVRTDFRSLDFLYNFTSLESLDISYIEDKWHLNYEYLINFTCLKVLNLAGTSPNSQIFKHLTSLESLDISHLRGPQFEYSDLNNCTNLKVLNLAGTNPDSRIFNHLTSLESLNVSNLNGNHFEYNYLKNCTNLKVLNLSGNRTNFFLLQYCPQISELYVKDCKEGKIFSSYAFTRFFKGKKVVDENGDSYECQFVEGKPEGHLKYSNALGIKKYEGNVIAGIYNGFGTSFYDNGKREYVGNFVNGAKKGHGVLYHLKGHKVFEGLFLDNLPKEGVLYNSQGGTIFQGTLLDHLPKEGALYLNDGDRFEGEFNFGKDESFAKGEFVSSYGGTVPYLKFLLPSWEEFLAKTSNIALNDLPPLRAI